MARIPWTAAALAALLAAASPALALQERKPPEKPVPADVDSVVELSYLAPVRSDVINPIGLARFQLSLESLVHGTLDDAARGSSLVVKGALFAGILLMDRTIAKVGHEYGHISVFNRAGYNEFLLTVGNQDPEPLSFREVFINSMVPQRHMAVQLTEEDALDAQTRYGPQDYDEFTAISYAGGLNQEQVHLNLYRERVLRHQFGFLDTSAYFVETISTIAYSSADDSDLGGYVSALERAGISTSVGQIKLMSLVRFFSGSAISAGIGFYKVMTEDKFDGFSPRVIGKSGEWTVLWPEFESYMTRRGPSVRGSLPLRAGGFLFLPALESAISGEGWEFEAGLEASRPMAPWLDVKASFFGGTEGGYWMDAGVALKPHPTLAILVGWHKARGYTFRRDVYGETFDFEHDSEWGLHLGGSVIFRF